MHTKNHPLTIVSTVALITSFGANTGKTGGGEWEKNTDKPDAIVSMHLAHDSNDNSDDDNELVKSFRYDDSNNERTNSDEESIKDKPIPSSEEKR